MVAGKGSGSDEKQAKRRCVCRHSNLKCQLHHGDKCRSESARAARGGRAAVEGQ